MLRFHGPWHRSEAAATHADADLIASAKHGRDPHASGVLPNGHEAGSFEPPVSTPHRVVRDGCVWEAPSCQ